MSDDLPERLRLNACRLAHESIGQAASRRVKVEIEAADEIERLEAELAAATVGVCEGCGSSSTMEHIRQVGALSCCPERKMLSAKEWHDRAMAAEDKIRARPLPADHRSFKPVKLKYSKDWPSDSEGY